MRYQVSIEGREAMVDVERADGGWRIRLDQGPWRSVQGRFVQPGELRLDGAIVGVHLRGDEVSLQVESHPLVATVVDPRRAGAEAAGAASEGTLSTPMPGVVVRIPVAVGDAVKMGQVVIVVEAMKMENEFKAAHDGVVEAIEVSVGDTLESGAVLARIASEA